MECVKITWNYFPCIVLHKVKSFHRLCARLGAAIIVDFNIDDFIFALYIFRKDGKAVNYNGSEIIALINLKYGKRTAKKPGKGQQRGINLNLYNNPSGD